MSCISIVSTYMVVVIIRSKNTFDQKTKVPYHPFLDISSKYVGLVHWKASSLPTLSLVDTILRILNDPNSFCPFYHLFTFNTRSTYYKFLFQFNRRTNRTKLISTVQTFYSMKNEGSNLQLSVRAYSSSILSAGINYLYLSISLILPEIVHA